MEKEMQSMKLSKGSKQSEGNIAWKAIWKFQISNAAKIFMWRACNNLLPTKHNLFWRGVIPDAQCPIYTRETKWKSIFYGVALMHQDLWENNTKKLQKGIGKGQNFIHMVEEMMGYWGTLWYMGVISPILTKFSEKPIILFDEFR